MVVQPWIAGVTSGRRRYHRPIAAGGKGRGYPAAVVEDLRTLAAHHELFRSFLSRDLKSRYKGSILGVLWSLATPLLMMAVYTVAFSQVMRAHPPHNGSYAVFFMSAYLPWTFFAMSLQMGSMALLSHTGLIQKVFFPREVLPLSSTTANLVNLGLALAVFLPFAFLLDGVSVTGLLVLVPVTIGLYLLAVGSRCSWPSPPSTSGTSSSCSGSCSPPGSS